MVLAHAKVNPFLRVRGRRDDGFHELETLVTPISLADRLEVHAYAGEEFRTLSISLEVTGGDALTRGVPRDDSNLVVRAAAALAHHGSVRGFADFMLEKHVPPAAGLGGGSADAAATIRALNASWGCALSDPQLRAIGAQIGSDVPALLAGRSVLVRGRGERVEPVAAPTLRWALVPFPFGISTSDAFRWWDEDACEPGPDPAALLDSIRSGDVQGVGRLLFNDLESAVIRRYPEVADAKEELLEAGALGAVMCGSGPTVAGLFADDAELALARAIDVRSI